MQKDKKKANLITNAEKSPKVISLGTFSHSDQAQTIWENKPLVLLGVARDHMPIKP